MLIIAMAALPAAAAGADGQPIEPGDVQALLRTGQLGEWLDEPLTLGQGVCIQSLYSLRWPDTARRPITDRQEEALRQARETCGPASQHEPGAPDPDARLVAAARMTFLARLHRLHGPQLAVQRCLKQSPDASVQDTCLRVAVGRPLTPEERKWLLAAALAPAATR